MPADSGTIAARRGQIRGFGGIGEGMEVKMAWMLSHFGIGQIGKAVLLISRAHPNKSPKGWAMPMIARGKAYCQGADVLIIWGNS